MRRIALLMVLGILFFPELAAAQESPQLPRSRISITPVVGYRIGTTAEGEMSVKLPDSTPIDFFEVEERLGSGPTMGAQLDLRVIGPLSLTGALTYTMPGETVATLRSDTVQNGRRRAPEVWFAKAGVTFRLPDPAPDSRSFHPAAFLTIAPGIIRETGDAWPFAPTEESSDHLALSIGGEAVTSLGAPWIALHLGVEDFIVFWDRYRRERAQEQDFGARYGGPTIVEFVYNPSHIILLRLGVSLRFF